ncbi:transposase [Fibrobacter sp.]|uniref:transposase n=1 Tax=Fibrobacter sp. TaxID=35828 RepID=UPI0025B8F0FB|nr:transposase [Fibrobacter sp.]MBR4007685.1 transposase [Fibrobacter sp.]
MDFVVILATIFPVAINIADSAHTIFAIICNLRIRNFLVASADALKGYPDAIGAAFPETDVQLCIVHQIRNSLKYVTSKNQKEFLVDLKLVYQASPLEKA